MLQLVCVPHGKSIVQDFIEEASKSKFREALYVTSSGDRVLKLRSHNINGTSFDMLAKDILKICGRNNVKLISRRTQEIIISQILKNRFADEIADKDSYFGHMVGKKGFLKAMTSLLGQLERADVKPEELGRALAVLRERENAEINIKDEETVRIYSIYKIYLKQMEVYDVEGMYRLAVKELEEMSCELPWKNIYISGFYAFSALEIKLIKALAEKCEVQIALPFAVEAAEDTDNAFGGRSEVYKAAASSFAELTENGNFKFLSPEQGTSLRTPVLDFLLHNYKRPISLSKKISLDDSLELWETAGRKEEMQSILRRIKLMLKKGESAQDIAVVFRNIDDYSGFRKMCDSYGIPADLAETGRLSDTPLLEYVNAFLACRQSIGRERVENCLYFLTLPWQRIYNKIDIEAVAQLSGKYYYTNSEKFLDILAGKSLDETGVSEEKTDAAKDETGVSEGKTDAAKDEKGLSEKEKNASEETEPSKENPVLLPLSLREKISAVPVRADIGEYAELVKESVGELNLPLLSGELYKKGSISLEAFKTATTSYKMFLKLVQRLEDDFAACGAEKIKMSLTEFRELLVDAAEKINIIIRPGNAEGIAVCAAASMDNKQFETVFIPGLRENEFPALRKESWIYNDGERKILRELGVELYGTAEAFNEDLHFFLTSCAAARKKLILSYFIDEERGRSPYLDELSTLFGNVEEKEQKIKLPVQEKYALNEKELKYSLSLAGKKEKLQQICSSELLEAALADSIRMTYKDSIFSGKIRDENLRRKIREVIGNTFSASRLQMYRKCPFSFLLSYVWGKKYSDDMGEDIDAGTNGNLIHKIMERFLLAHRGEKLVGTYDDLAAELEEIACNTLDEYKQKGDIYAGKIQETEEKILYGQLRSWLKKEMEYDEAWDGTYYAAEKKLKKDGMLCEIDTGKHKIKVTGSIDRIDSLDGKLFLTDYKTGLVPGVKDFLDTNLQIPLYMVMLQDMEDGSVVVGGGFYKIGNENKRSGNFVLKDVMDKLKGDKHSVPFGFNGRNTFSNLSRYSDSDEGKGLEVGHMEQLRELLYAELDDILDNIEAGNFPVTPYPNCDKYCPGAVICRKSMFETDEEEDVDA